MKPWVFLFSFFFYFCFQTPIQPLLKALSGYLSIAIFYHIARSFAPLAGLVINPAITIVVAVQYALQGNTDSLANLWAWLVGDFLGCMAAILFYDKLYEPIVS